MLLLAIARLAGRPLPRPRGTDWLWLAAVAAAGLVLFNVAIVRGVAHAEPAVIGVAVAMVPIALAVAGPLAAGRRPAAVDRGGSRGRHASVPCSSRAAAAPTWRASRGRPW